MSDFNTFLEKTGEVGYVEQVVHTVCYATGLPQVRPNEVVVFETGAIGHVLSLSKEHVEILLLSDIKVNVGGRIARTGSTVQVGVGNALLGRVLDPLGRPLDSSKEIEYEELRNVDTPPLGVMERKEVDKALETGVALVDTIIPIAKGQRELVIGDRKTGKTQFLLQTVLNQSNKGAVCIYAVIGQKRIEMQRLVEFFAEKNILGRTIVVGASSANTAGLIFLAPYTAMTMAEYFRDQGLDVLVVLDDLTTHARYYRQISLLARRFPGRSSYPGDIFYIHSRLLERGGNFNKGSITCLPCTESILGDLSGYIQTNIMAMTDGHIFFDIDLFNQGRRPAINPFLSVTRVGHQAQTQLQREISSKLSSFLVEHEKMQQFMHFGAEAGENVKKVLDRGEKLLMLFSQPAINVIPMNINLLLIGGLWAGVWNEIKTQQMKQEAEQVFLAYMTDPAYKKVVDDYIAENKKFDDLINNLRQKDNIITDKYVRSR